MPIFKLPLSGDVAQTINPWTAIFAPMGGQWGIVNVNLGLSRAPEIEQEVLTDVGSYGRQLGRIGDAMEVLLDHFHPKRPLDEKEQAAIDDLRKMLAKIDAIKKRRR